eukprot:Sspe_Gene.74248::Locus_45814_Transcript_1_1_Confidence_1.000_Length_667::g.74248::m.74248
MKKEGSNPELDSQATDITLSDVDEGELGTPHPPPLTFAGRAEDDRSSRSEAGEGGSVQGDDESGSGGSVLQHADVEGDEPSWFSRPSTFAPCPPKGDPLHRRRVTTSSTEGSVTSGGSAAIGEAEEVIPPNLLPLLPRGVVDQVRNIILSREWWKREAVSHRESAEALEEDVRLLREDNTRLEESVFKFAAEKATWSAQGGKEV